MDDRRGGYLAKFDRANTHLKELHSAVDTFMEEDAHRVFTHLDLEHGIATVYSRVLDYDRVFKWGVVIGDVLHNYRDALDHLAYQLACLVHDPPTRKTEWPIFLKSEDFRCFKKDGVTPAPGSGLHKIRCLDPADQATIEGYQPYDPIGGTPADPKSDPLWLLQKFNNLDKHNVIAVTAVVGSFPKLTPLYDQDRLEIFGAVERPPRGPLEYGTPIAQYRFRQTGPDPEMDVKAEGSFAVVFGKGTPAPDQGLFKTLGDIRSRVEAILWMMGGRFLQNAP